MIVAAGGEPGPFLDMSLKRWFTADEFLTDLHELEDAWDGFTQAKAALQIASGGAEAAASFVSFSCS